MAKKERAASPNPAGVANRETLQRLNFLYQASTYLVHVAGTRDSLPGSGKHVDDDRLGNSLGALSRRYTQDMRDISLKTVTKIDPTMKRAMCRTCGSVLIVGRTARMNVKYSSTHGHKVRSRCDHCGSSRAIPAPSIDPSNGEQAESSARTGQDCGTDIPRGTLDITSSDMAIDRDEDTINPAQSLHVLPPSTVRLVKPTDPPTTLDDAPTLGLKKGKSTSSRRRRDSKHVGKLPLFARGDAGHVVFKGSEAVDVPLS